MVCNQARVVGSHLIKKEAIKGDRALHEKLRQIRLSLLARPKHLHEIPEGFDYQIVQCRPPEAALRFEPSPRLICLAAANAKKRRSKYVPPEPELHYVPLHTLYYLPSHAIRRLAKRRPKKIKQTPQEHEEKVQKHREHKLKRLLFEGNRKHWLKMRASPKPTEVKLHEHPYDIDLIIQGNKMFIKEEEIDQCVIHPKRKVRRVIDFERINQLAVPTQIRPKYKVEKIKDTYFEKRAKDLKTPLSKRLAELYLPRQLPEEALLDLNFEPFAVSKAALKYKATPRIEELAQPVQKWEEEDEDENENAFKVPRRALRAICSKRVAELARPIIRD